MRFHQQRTGACDPKGSAAPRAAVGVGRAIARTAAAGALVAGLVLATAPLSAQPRVAGEAGASGPDGAAAGTAGAVCATSATEHVRQDYDRLADALGRRGSVPTERLNTRLDSLLADVFSLQTAAARAYGPNDWVELDAHRRGEFTRALTRHYRSRLLSYLERTGGLPRIQAGQEGGRGENGGTVAEFWMVRDGTTEPVTFHLAADADGSCGIVDVQGVEWRLSEGVRSRVRSLIDDYSFPYMIAEIGRYDHVVLEDFERTPVGELPVGWDWKDKDDDKHKPYRVVEENGNKFLEATDEGESVILGREIRWNLNEYPLVSFRVRVNAIPEGGDERYDDRVDSAAGLYFTVNKKFLGTIPESVKYVWSSTLPVGSAAIRDGIGRPWQVVFGSGRTGLGEWRTYVFDLKQAYRDTFRKDPPSKPLGIGVLSDANSTNSRAYADYDDIRALKRAPPGATVTSGVRKILDTP